MKSAPKNIFEIAQQIAGSVPQNGNQGDINHMIKHVTESVMKMVDSGDIDINQMTSGLLSGMQPATQSIQPTKPQQIPSSRVDLGASRKPSQQKTDEAPGDPTQHHQYKEPQPKTLEYEELEDNESVDDLSPRTRDININMNVSLVDLYNGVKKKIAIRRKRLKNIHGQVVQVEEKKKFVVNVLPGMKDEQVIRFSKESDEQEGYETGDIVITIHENANETFERDGDNLFVIKQIGLYEAYTTITKHTPIVIKHIDGTYMECLPTESLLHENNGMRKITGKGMPIYKNKGPKSHIKYGDLYIRFNLTLPPQINVEHYRTLSTLFTPINDTDTLDIFRYKEKENKYSKIKGTDLILETCQMEDLTEQDMRDINNSEEDTEYSSHSEDQSEDSSDLEDIQT